MDLFGVDSTIDRALFVTSVVLLGWLIWIPVGGYVASQKHRSVVEGILMGCLGPIGVLVVALLPTKSVDEL